MLINSLSNFIHHLLNPHCAHCEMLSNKDKECKSCETLKIQLDIARQENRELLQSILDIVHPKVEIKTDESNHEPVRTTPVSWRIKRQQLERSSREEYRRMREAARNGTTISIEELEKQAGISGEIKNEVESAS